MSANERRSAAPELDLLALKRSAPDYVPPPSPPVSWEAFLAWLDEDTFAEWVDGAIIEMPPVRDDHQLILGLIYRLLMAVVEERRPGTIFLAPFLMRLPLRPSGREPDLIFVRAANSARIAPTYVNGPADLVVEIVSPESRARDYRKKLIEYQAAGIPEYWIVDPRRREARFYQLGEDGAYRLGSVDVDGIYNSPVVTGFRLRVSWFWQQPLPTLAAVLADLPD